MPDLLDIFANQPAKYDLLVSREDYEGNLLSAGTELGKALIGLAGKIAGVPAPKEKGKQRQGLSIF